jgi:hypothetical protein
MERRGTGASPAISNSIAIRRMQSRYQEIVALRITLFQGGAIRIKRTRLWYLVTTMGVLGNAIERGAIGTCSAGLTCEVVDVSGIVGASCMLRAFYF